MLHIHNGGSTANTLKEFGFPGEHRAFQEVLMAGPTPRGLSPVEWQETRAKFLADAYELKHDYCLNSLLEQEANLRGFAAHHETILWFEHDLFCQINLIYLLDWFSKQSRGNSRLSLICIGEFPGIDDFRGLGQLTGDQLASLFESRHEVTDAEMKIAARAWAAYCSPNPQEITHLLNQDTSPMPFLGNALHLHLMRFPSLTNGLGRIEQRALEMLAKGAIGFKSLFPAFGQTEPSYGMGDLQFWSELKRLATARKPLITISGLRNDESFKSNKFHDAWWELTGTGQAVLAGKTDFVDINGIDLWLGGVHLVDDEVWRWDEQLQELMHNA